MSGWQARAIDLARLDLLFYFLISIFCNEEAL